MFRFGKSSAPTTPTEFVARVGASARASKPWMLFLGTCMTFALLGLVVASVVTVTSGSLSSDAGFIRSFQGLVYAFSALGYMYPAYLTVSSARAIDREHSLDDMEDYIKWVETQARLWRYVGTITMVMICLYGLLFAGLLLDGIR